MNHLESEQINPLKQPQDFPEKQTVDDLVRAGMTEEEAKKEIARRQKERGVRARQQIKKDTDEHLQM